MKKMILGIPNGSLAEATMNLLKKIGVKIIVNGRKFYSTVEGSDIFDRAIIMRPQDMPEALVDGMIDVGILGKDWFIESGLDDGLIKICELEYSKKTNQPVKLVIFGKKEELIDKKGILVTSEYPEITKRFFKRATIRFSHGGTEQKVAYGKYDYGVCVTETGDTIIENSLRVVKVIMESPTILTARENSDEVKFFGELLSAALRSEEYRLIKMNVTEEILKSVLDILPALEAPTVNKLSNGNFAVETVAPKNNISNLVVKLKALGVNGILAHKLDLVC